MIPSQNSSYFGGYTYYTGKRSTRFQQLSTMLRHWVKYTFLGLFVVGIVLPTPASTTYLYEKQDFGISQGHSLIPVDARPPFHHMAEFPSLVGEPDYEFIETKTPTGDLLTVAIVNEVLWNRVPVGQVDRQWLPPVDTESK